MADGRLRIAVLIGAEPYQAHHVADIAFELADRDGVEVEVVALLPESLAEVERLERDARDGSIPKRLLDVPPLLRLAQRIRVLGSLKVPIMQRNAALLSTYDAIVTPSDHAQFVRPLLDPLPRMIYLSHGIGGRAAAYTDKYHAFDFALVTGPGDERRLLDKRLIRPGRYAVIGYPKLESARRLAGHSPKLFDNDRPTLLFNPHSKRSLRSWERFARPLIEAASGSGGFNLLVAPHVKLFGRRPRWAWRRWQRLAVPGQVIVDLGSSASLDMTYSLAADIYAGDVSSQIYEFLTEPRPCVFLNAHKLAWQGDPDFPNWTLGDVVETPQQAIDAIGVARARHPLYVQRQRERMAQIVDWRPGAAARGADAVLAFLARPQPQRLMFLLSDLGTGGTARATVQVAGGLAASGHDVSLVVARGGGPLTDQLDSRVRLIELASGRPRGARLLLSAWALSRVIRAQRPDRIVSAGNHMHGVAVLAHALSGGRADLALKMTNPVERPGDGRLGNALRRLWARRAFARAERVLLITGSARDETARDFPQAAARLRVVDNPYVTDAMVAAASDPSFESGRLLAIGRLVEQKNYPLLLEALARTRDHDWTLDVLGDGPLLEPLQRQAQALGIGDRVRFRGFVAEPVPFLQRAHALVLSSAWEGQGAVLIEALACGCPVIATRSTSAIGDALGEGRFGTLVPPGDPDKLAAAIRAELRERSPVSDEARAWADRYRIDAGVRSHAEALGLA